MIPEQKKFSYSEFLELNKSDQRFEYINGEIYLQSSPTVEHQRALLNIATEFKKYFGEKDCEPFIAPLDVLLQNEKDSHPHHLNPDIMVICDQSGLRLNEYRGVPSLIVEIVSPSNTAYDRITKFNLYMKYGVKEYWLVNPKFRTIEVNVLNEDGFYEQVGIYKNDEIAVSQIFGDLTIGLDGMF